MKLYHKVGLSLVAVALAVFAGSSQADAFWGHHRRVTTTYSIPTVPVVTVPGYTVTQRVIVRRPVLMAAPLVVGYAPAPGVVYPAAPATYVAPTTSFYAPTTTYYAPAGVTTYYAPTPILAPGRVIIVP